MPFVQRVVTPIYISRSKKSSSRPNGTPSTVAAGSSPADRRFGGAAADGCGLLASEEATGASSALALPASDYEFEAVTNLTLSNALRQLASLVLIANDIFNELHGELQLVGERARGIKGRVERLAEAVDAFDPKMVAVPESDLATFVQIKNHFRTSHRIDTGLFTPASRSDNVRQLYEAAAKTPVDSLDEMDRIVGRRERRSSDNFLCTPVLGMSRRRMRTNIDVEIETRMPAALDDLRRWTSTEAIGDITVTPDCVARVTGIAATSSRNTTAVTNATVHSLTLSAISAPSSADTTDDTAGAHQISRLCSDTLSTDMPLDHRLPSPEEQCQIIALKFPAEVICVDTSGRRFQRMCVARKSMLATASRSTAAAEGGLQIGDHNNLSEDVQTVKRRSRSRKARHKRRNTIAGTDQKEIEEAAKGENDHEDDAQDLAQAPDSIQLDSVTTTSGTLGGVLSVHHHQTAATTSVHVPRSKSSDLLKKDSPTNPNDVAKTLASRLSHFNTLKQWGRNRFRSIQRSTDAQSAEKRSSSSNDTTRVSDADDDVNVYETMTAKHKRKFLEKERKLSHERKPSYSSSEKSLACTLSQSSATTSTAAASINPVKLRESSAIRRQRRNGLGHKDEMNSSSGNWSASSESGRTSIGSELTVPPKSSASSTSLNHSHTMGSGPPSSIISRRRFLNTSASSSVTSEGTVTPDIQMPTDSYDDETSSAYSCDTEGYYTSFHVDSGLKTLKEEEPVTPLHTSSALSSTNSFGSTSNNTVLSADNEYELFGKGSTSTTASSAGTVCTTLMTAGSDRCLVMSPCVPERKSSLTKLNRSNSTNSNSTLERSCSSSTVGSTLERTGTIKRNGILLKKEIKSQKESNVTVHSVVSQRVESPDSGNNTSSSPVETNSSSSPVHGNGPRSNSEFEYSESSDLEGVERVERIRVKTTINSSRIPSLCVITPSNSDDDEHLAVRARHASPPRQETEPRTQPPKESEYAEITSFPNPATTLPSKPHVVAAELKKDYFKRTSLLPLNSMLDRLKGVLPHLKHKPIKETASSTSTHDPIYDNAGEYVTIADVANNNQMKRQQTGGYYYSNDLLKQNLATVLSGNLNEETEYVSLNELPLSSLRCESNLLAIPHIPSPSHRSPLHRDEKINSCSEAAAKVGDDDRRVGNGATTKHQDDEGMLHRAGARVTLDANGKVVYNSDSLKRRKGAHTTFAPGPCVKIAQEDIPSPALETHTAAGNAVVAAAPSRVSQGDPIQRKQITAEIVGGHSHRRPSHIRPVISQSLHTPIPHFKDTDILAQSTSSGVPRETAENTAASTDSSSTNQISESDPTMGETSQLARSSFKAHQIPSVSSNMLKSAYISSPPTQMQTTHNTQDLLGTQGYRRSPLDQVDSAEPPNHPNTSYVSSTLPRARPALPSFEPTTTPMQPYQSSVVTPVAIPFQRSNNAYWTLQTRKQPSHPVLPPTRDDLQLAQPKPYNNLEELYSTPNKLLKTRRTNTTATDQLRPTAHGFANYFSPIPKAQQPSSTEPDLLHQQNIISPIDPRHASSSFKTSTPTKPTPTWNTPLISLADELRQKLHTKDAAGFGSNVSSPLSSGRSTPRLEPQAGRNADPTSDLSQHCSDRLGAPKTSLMDFKKLLLTKAGKSVPTVTKPSAVEQLKLAKAAAAATAAGSAPSATTASLHNAGVMNLIDMSGSPKTFANRRMIRQGNFGSPSKNNQPAANPSAIGKHMSPRSAWKFANYRTDVMSTSIPEANSEEDASPNNSKERGKGSALRAKSTGGLIRSASSQEPIAPITNDHTDNGASTSPTQPPPAANIIAENINLKTNIFLQAEENNFMRGEIGTKSLSRAQLQQARSQFLTGNGGPASLIPGSPQQPLRSAQFKNGHYTGISPTRQPNKPVAVAASMFRANTEAIVETNPEGVPAPSLETAL